MAQKRKLDNYDDDFDFDTESLSSFESDEDFVHSISSSEDDTSDEEKFSKESTIHRICHRGPTVLCLISVNPHRVRVSSLTLNLPCSCSFAISTVPKSALIRGLNIAGGSQTAPSSKGAYGAITVHMAREASLRPISER
ncbi:hypothetical protein TNCV_3842221 [Trichonephila clavipes]|nr:hypothetical protein TNCV_3842221 [Trichonephila clavipes]